MKLLIKKIFNLSDIRYPWIILISMLLFVFSLYNNKINPDINTTVELITYGTSVGFAFIWSILNYVDHIKVNAIYKKNDSIEAYVDSLIMKKEEKEDLKEYLNDFVRDLEEGGKTKDEAIKTAISQFQVKEFTSLSKNAGILELPTHNYLIGYVLVFMTAAVVISSLTNTILSNLFWLHAINFMLVLYSISFIGLLLLYKLIDRVVAKKLMH